MYVRDTTESLIMTVMLSYALHCSLHSNDPNIEKLPLTGSPVSLLCYNRNIQDYFYMSCGVSSQSCATQCYILIDNIHVQNLVNQLCLSITTRTYNSSCCWLKSVELLHHRIQAALTFTVTFRAIIDTPSY